MTGEITLSRKEATDTLRCLFSYVTLAKVSHGVTPKLTCEMIKTIQARLKE